jgi:DNA-binding transcriptional LysR family regulator
VTLQQLRCFQASVRSGSFTAAARILDVSQPAVAEQVRNLEQILGTALFARVGRGVRLTSAGTAFADRAPAILRSLEEAIEAVDEVRAVRTGTLAAGLLATPEAYEIDRFAARFAREHPGVVLRLLGRNSSVVADRVRSGDLEAGMVSLPIDDEGLEVRPFARDRVLYVSADADRTARPLAVAELVRRPLVVYDAEAGDRDPLRRQMALHAQELGLRLSPRAETETMIMALRLVADGIGDTYVPRAHTFAPYFPSGLSTTRFDPPIHDTFAIVTRRGTKLSPATGAFVAGLTAHVIGLHIGLEAVSRPGPTLAPKA